MEMGDAVRMAASRLMKLSVLIRAFSRVKIWAEITRWSYKREGRIAGLQCVELSYLLIFLSVSFFFSLRQQEVIEYHNKAYSILHAKYQDRNNQSSNLSNEPRKAYKAKRHDCYCSWSRSKPFKQQFCGLQLNWEDFYFLNICSTAVEYSLANKNDNQRIFKDNICSRKV